MAHSIIKFCDRRARIHDADLMAVLCLVIDAAVEASRLEPTLRASIHLWQASLRDWGAGCIDLGLDTALSTPSAVNEFVALLGAACRQVTSFGGEVPSNYLNERLQLQGPVARVSLPGPLAWAALASLRELVTFPG